MKENPTLLFELGGLAWARVPPKTTKSHRNTNFRILLLPILQIVLGGVPILGQIATETSTLRLVFSTCRRSFTVCLRFNSSTLRFEFVGPACARTTKSRRTPTLRFGFSRLLAHLFMKIFQFFTNCDWWFPQIDDLRQGATETPTLRFVFAICRSNLATHV